jgi:7-cyano-7-deazaguanine synthase in queuosine biosynthesis
MSQLDYTYIFDDLSDGYTNVHWIHHRAQQPSQTFRLRVDDEQFHWKRRYHLSPLLADCIDLASAVAVADRLSSRKRYQSCFLQICLPVRHPELFGCSVILQHLQDILYWYTQDHWSFDFSCRSAYGRLAERELSLLNPGSYGLPTEVALWSGGLDSLAGLYSRVKNGPASSHYVLFGTGANTFIHSKQRDAAEAIDALFPDRTNLVQVPLRLGETKEMRKHSLQRSRGFVFLLLGAVCAMLEGQQALSVYENGIGAINLLFTRAEVGLDHSLSVHPVSLIRMGEFISQLFGTHFTFQNPFLFQTKAQMCAPLTTSAAFERLVLSTFTCDRYLRDRPQQCGRCSSCLLRRQAIAVLDVGEDPTPYCMTTPARDGQMRRISDGDHLRAMETQVASLRACLATENPWENLSRYAPQLLEIVDEMAGKQLFSRDRLINDLIQLYTCYVSEWNERVCQVVHCGFAEYPIEIQRL